MYLNSGCFIVEGKVYSCIYNFSNNKLYHIDHYVAEVINKIIQNKSFK